MTKANSEQLVAYFLSFLPFQMYLIWHCIKYLRKCSRMVTIVNIVDFRANFHSNLRKILKRFELSNLWQSTIVPSRQWITSWHCARAQSANSMNFQKIFSRDLRTLIILNGFGQQLQSLKCLASHFAERDPDVSASCMTNVLRVVS